MSTTRNKQKAAPQPKIQEQSLKQAGACLLLLCVTLLAYLPALRGELLWDDNMHVTRPDLQSLNGLWRIWFELGATQQYYPLLHSAFWLEHHIWGNAVLGYHLTNVCLHSLAACLLVMILRKLSIPGAWLAGLLFALHPVAVEAVAWVSEQKSTLSAVFYLAAALLYLHFDDSRKKSRYFTALAFFALALMTKSVTATLPAVLLVLFWWQRGRLDLKRDIAPLLPWFVIGASSGLFTAWVERSPTLIGAAGSKYALSLADRFVLAGRVPWFYAWKDILPVNLMFIYPRWNISATQLWQWSFLIALIALAAALVWLARSNRTPLAAFLFFVGTLFPALGFLNVYPFRYSYVADHFQYLALIGVVVPVAAWLTTRISINKAALIAIPLAAATFIQSANYKDYETLFRATIARNSGSSFLHSNLGVILMASEREAEAATEFKEAVRLTPDDPEYRVNYGLALAQVPNNLPQAIAEYQTALRLSPDRPSAHLNLGLAYAAMPGRLNDAVAEYQKAVAGYKSSMKEEASFWQAHYNLGLAYAQMPGRDADAASEYRTALRLKPDSALAHFQLGNTLHKSGDLPGAVSEYRASLEIVPEAAEVHYELAYALAQIPGHVREAIEECRKMLILKPNDVAGRQLMQSLLAFQNSPR